MRDCLAIRMILKYTFACLNPVCLAVFILKLFVVFAFMFREGFGTI